jgi:hypothetical protein
MKSIVTWPSQSLKAAMDKTVDLHIYKSLKQNLEITCQTVNEIVSTLFY